MIVLYFQVKTLHKLLFFGYQVLNELAYGKKKRSYEYQAVSRYLLYWKLSKPAEGLNGEKIASAEPMVFLVFDLEINTKNTGKLRKIVTKQSPLLALIDSNKLSLI